MTHCLQRAKLYLQASTSVAAYESTGYKCDERSIVNELTSRPVFADSVECCAHQSDITSALAHQHETQRDEEELISGRTPLKSIFTFQNIVQNLVVLAGVRVVQQVLRKERSLKTNTTER